MAHAFELFRLKPGPELISAADDIFTGEALSLETLSQLNQKVQSQVHPDLFAQASRFEQEAAAKRSSQYSQAFRLLSSPLERIRLWLSLIGVDIESSALGVTEELFEEQMEWQQKIQEFRMSDSHDPLQRQAEYEALAVQLDEAIQTTLQWFIDYQQQIESHPADASIFLSLSRLATFSRLREQIKDLV